MGTVSEAVGAQIRSSADEAVRRLTNTVGGPARRRVVVLLALVLALQSADTATIAAVGGELERSLHIGNAELGLLASVTVLMGAVGSIPAGILVDRLRRTTLLAIAIVGWSGALVVSATAQSFEMLLVTRLALGLLVAVAGPCVASLTGDFIPAAERARVYGFILAGDLVGGAFGFLISGELASAISWRASFVVLALPGLLLAWAIRRYLPEPARGGRSHLEEGATAIRSDKEPVQDGDEQPERRDGLAQEQVARRNVAPREALVRTPSRMSAGQAVRYVLSIPTNRTLIVASSLGYFFLNGLQTFAVVYVKAHFGIGHGAATALLALLVVFSLLGAIFGGRLADRLLARGRITARIVVPAVAYTSASLIFVPALALSSLAIAFPLLMLGALCLTATNAPLDAARLDIIPSWLWGRAEGVRTVLRSVAQALAPFLFGVLSEVLGSGRSTTGAGHGLGSSANADGLEYTFLIMLVALLISGLIMLRARRSYPRDVATALESES
jgi:MFS family permease